MTDFLLDDELFNQLANTFEYVADKLPLIEDEYEEPYIKKIEDILKGEYTYDNMKNLRNLLYDGGDNMMNWEINYALSQCCKILREIRRAKLKLV